VTSRRDFLAAAAALALPPASAQSGDLTALTLKQASDLLRSGRAFPLDLTEACLRRIEKYDPALHSFITITAEQARATARERLSEQRRGHWRGPLHGIPIAFKDNIDTAGIRTTGGSELFQDRVPAQDAERCLPVSTC
jgi:aspartyl-tRNA(Asn)/glutamyl-tRNA(Gln) amidotransferase subunit A